MIGRGGRLRAAINLGNPILARRDRDGALAGVSVALARELGRRNGQAVELVAYEGAGRVVDAAGSDAWDVAFLAIDPKRAAEIAFTRPYLEIDGVFVVAEDAPFGSPDDLDQPGVRIAVGRGAAYDLYLGRATKHAELVRVATSAEALPHFLAHGLQAAAGVRQAAAQFVATRPGLRLVEPPFMSIRQAMALPIADAATLPDLQAFLDEAIAQGLVAREAGVFAA